MIASHGQDGGQVQRGLQQSLRRFSGATAARVIEPPGAKIAEHHHDWPVLTLYVIGDVIRLADRGDVRMNRPAIALHAAKEAHANRVGASGLEQIDIEFDPDWLQPFAGKSEWAIGGAWIGGRLAAKANVLSRKWTDQSADERELARLTAELITEAFRSEPAREPSWLQGVLQEVAHGRAQSIAELAGQFGLHPGWLAQSYRAAAGEGLGEAIQRYRVQRAVTLLRTTSAQAAEVAAEAGFCDQSHMIRWFRRLLGRTPSCIRAERDQLAKIGTPGQ